MSFGFMVELNAAAVACCCLLLPARPAVAHKQKMPLHFIWRGSPAKTVVWRGDLWR